MKFVLPTAEDGDKQFDFDTATAAGLADAEAKFKELTGKGFMPVKMDGGAPTKMRSFDKEAEEVFFRPQLQGG
jgi:hypothetical protein